MALAATYVSIRQRTNVALTLHVIADESVTKFTRHRLRSCMHGDDKLRFIAAESVPESFQLARAMDGHFSPAIIWRAWLPEYLPNLKRCISLDCDLQVLMDICLIWDLPLKDHALSAFQGGKPHPSDYYDWIRTSQDRYFRMGVCLMDLRSIRNCRDFVQGRLGFLHEARSLLVTIPQAGLFEQSLYNRYFSSQYFPLPFQLVPSNRLYLHQDRRIWLYGLLSAHEPIILDLKGWLNHSSLSLFFWSALLHTPWREDAEKQINLTGSYQTLS